MMWPQKNMEYAVSVLVAFPMGGMPVPHKVKVKNREGGFDTFTVDRVESIVEAVTYISFTCMTYGENGSRQYCLTLWKEKLQWRLLLM